MGIAKWISSTVCVCLVAVSAGGQQTSVGLENMAQVLRGDVRLVVMGDSYSTPMWGRVPTATLRAWPINGVKSICGSAPQYGQFIRALAECSPESSLLWSDPAKYTAMRASTTPEYFSLPMRGIRETYTDSNFVAGPSGKLFQFRFDDSMMNQGASGPFAIPGSKLRFRFLYWASRDPFNTMVPSLNLHDLNQYVATIDLLSGARPYWHLGENPNLGTRDAIALQINAAGVDIPANQDVSNLLRVGLFESSPLVGTSKYLNPAGGVYYHVDLAGNRIPGFYYSFLADDGWSYSGFGSDVAAINESDRRFSEDQFVHWLDVTTLDRAQPVVFMWYLAPEWLHYTATKLAIEGMLDQADSSAQRVGLANWQHMLVMPHMFRFGSLGNSPEAHVWMQEQRDAMVTIATERNNVAFASIYDATNGMLFDGTAEGNAWLLAHGFDSFHYGANIVDLVNGSLAGDLLDAANLHPWGSDSGAFFAAVLGNIIRDAGCPADISVDGVIDINDLLAMIAGWGTAATDITGDGTTNISDLLLLLDAWGDCWPVQAPFDTPAFP